MTSNPHHPFLFESLGSKQPSTTRKVHLRRLYDILQLSIQRRDHQRAKRVWAILARCPELDWLSLWATGLQFLGGDQETSNDRQSAVDYLRAIMLQYPDNRELILKELILRLIVEGKFREALDELELYLPSFPYQDNPEFHVYAGLISLYLAQPEPVSSTYNAILLRDAHTHLDHAKTLDPDNILAKCFLKKAELLQTGGHINEGDSDDENMILDKGQPDRKRARS